MDDKRTHFNFLKTTEVYRLCDKLGDEARRQYSHSQFHWCKELRPEVIGLKPPSTKLAFISVWIESWERTFHTRQVHVMFRRRWPRCHDFKCGWFWYVKRRKCISPSFMMKEFYCYKRSVRSRCVIILFLKLIIAHAVHLQHLTDICSRYYSGFVKVGPQNLCKHFWLSAKVNNGLSGNECHSGAQVCTCKRMFH